VLAYAMPPYTKPEKNRTSIQFGEIPRDNARQSWGIPLSFAARERLRSALARGPVRVRVSTDVVWVPNAVERSVVAEVRGATRPDERFVFSAHVQEPGANDNASGVGAQTEMARVAAELVHAGLIDPKRTITFLWGLEIRSTERYITQDVARARGIRWGLYHTDGDRLPMVSAEEMANVGVSALVSALVLASADGATARAIVGEVERAARKRLATEAALGAGAIRSAGDAEKERDILETWGQWYDGALGATVDIEVGGSTRETRSAIEAARSGLRAAVRTAATAMLAKPPAP
jgi:hypothetical protein